MNFLSKLIDKLYLKQWSIGIASQSIEEMIRNKKFENNIEWFPLNNKYQFYADPFIFKSLNNQYCVLYEDYNYNEQYGKISMSFLDNRNCPISTKIVLDTKSHLSYPSVFIEEQNIYIFPEAGASWKLSCYCYNNITESLNYITDIINLPLTDATILKYNGKYWIFSTISRGENSNKKLYIFFSDNLFGPYIPHPKNPVRDNINGSRPAGNFIVIDGNIYRPAQNSGKYYGSSIAITKIIALNETEFIEENYMTLNPGKKESFNFGIHTINYQDDLIVIDGLRRIFAPLAQITTFIKKKLK